MCLIALARSGFLFSPSIAGRPVARQNNILRAEYFFIGTNHDGFE